MTLNTECKNCESTLDSAHRFCPHCGQTADLHRLGFHDILHETFHYFTHADKGLLQLLRDLATKRGVVAREFVLGKRKKYFSPLNFFLIVAAVYVFMFSMQTVVGGDITIDTGLQPWQVRKAKSAMFFNKYSNFIAMLAVPFTALLFYAFYRKAKYNYVEHLVACMYMVGFFLLCHAVIILPTAKILDIPSNYALMALFLLQIAYSAAFYYGFTNGNSRAAKLKAIGVAIATTVIWVMLSGLAVQSYIASGFWGLMP